MGCAHSDSTRNRWPAFLKEFKEHGGARGDVGDTGFNHPDQWVGGLASPDLHAIAILFARDSVERARSLAEHANLLARCDGVEVLSSLELEATPPCEYADHPDTATGFRSPWRAVASSRRLDRGSAQAG